MFVSLDLVNLDWQQMAHLPRSIVPGLVLLASLTGSLHCAGMCGPLVLLAKQSNHPMSSSWIYHLSRWLSYIIIGALSGLLGGWLLGSSRQIVTSVAAIIVAGLFLHMAWSLFRGRTPHLPLPKQLLSWQNRIWAKSLKSSKVQLFKPALLGILTPLLPCGWLYAFVFGAVASESAWYGAILMTFFWLGTLPILLAIGHLSQRPMAWLRPQYRWIGGGLLLVAGLYTLASKVLGACH